MKTTRHCTWIIILLFIASCTKPESEKVYQEVSGLIEIDIEEVSINGWKFKNNDIGFSGAGYLEWEGEGINYNHEMGVLKFVLQVEQAGDYYFRIFNRHDHPDDFTENNDIFTKLGEGEWIKTFSHYSHKKWGWDTRYDLGDHQFVDPPKVTLKKGTNEFFIGGRSPGFKMDKIHFFHTELRADDYETHAPAPTPTPTPTVDNQHEVSTH